MDTYDRCTNLGEKIVPIVLPSMVNVENFSDHPRIIAWYLNTHVGEYGSLAKSVIICPTGLVKWMFWL
jgi:hypothetical protein